MTTYHLSRNGGFWTAWRDNAGQRISIDRDGIKQPGDVIVFPSGRALVAEWMPDEDGQVVPASVTVR